jgi:hypothetical protein
MKSKEPVCPKPVKIDSRICFGIMYFATEADAQKAHEYVRAKGFTYNGGFFHGMPCGRDPSFDHDGLFAVTE